LPGKCTKAKADARANYETEMRVIVPTEYLPLVIYMEYVAVIIYAVIFFIVPVVGAFVLGGFGAADVLDASSLCT
jgi:hypothetical protein